MAFKLPHVTVILRSRNCEKIIGQTLSALYSQNFSDFDLLVVDSSSKDRTLEIVRGIDPFCRIVSIAAEDYFPGKVLNNAIRISLSEIVVFLNSDAVFLTPDSLSNLLSVFEDKSVQAAFGRQVPRPDAKTWVEWDYAKCFPDGGSAPWWIPLSLPLAAMRRPVWEKRPFYTDAWGSEDTEWGHWARENGIDIRYVANAMAMHSHNYTFKQLYGRRFIEGEADAFIYKQSYSFWDMAVQMIRALGGDCAVHFRFKDICGLLQMPFVRLVYFWAYYQGHRLGSKRLKSRDGNARVGQEEVLKRYDS